MNQKVLFIPQGALLFRSTSTDFLRLIYNKSVFYLKYPVRHFGKLPVVGYDYNCLTECIPELKEELMKLVFILTIKVS